MADTDQEPKDDEDEILVDTLKDVELVMDLARANHIKDLHNHESGEDKGQMAGWTQVLFHFDGIKWLTIETGAKTGVYHQRFGILVSGVLGINLGKDVLTSEQESEENGTLPEGLTKNVLDHLTANDVIFTVLGWSLQEFWFWQFGGESQGSKRVHDQVHPKQLNSLQR